LIETQDSGNIQKKTFDLGNVRLEVCSMKTSIISASCAIAIGATTPVFAGEPDNPGVGGQVISSVARSGNLSQVNRDIREDGRTLGGDVQDVRAYNGGNPNPDNDNGGGNDE
jgi:hypothetical protein